MSVQKIVMSSPTLTRAFMSSTSPGFHERSGRKLAAETLRVAVRETKAYPRLLREIGIDPEAALKTGMEGWSELPVIDKSSYVAANPIEDIVRGGSMHAGYTIEKSSGHSGERYYWFRTPQEDELLPTYLEYAFRQYYGIDTTSTLVVIGLALGTWTSGEKMAQALRQVAASGKYPLTIMSPGNKDDEILEIVKDLSPRFDQTVIVGYPPFLKHVIDCGVAHGIDWAAAGVKLGLGGEGWSEEWRDQVASQIGIDSSKDLLAVSGGYGAADLGMSLGREYPLTVLIRKLAQDDSGLRRALFGDTLPMLFQYSPGTGFIEEIENELVFTVPSGIPLVRYNIHDTGGVIPHARMLETLNDFGYDMPAMLQERGYGKGDLWTLPFFYCYGRSDGTIMLAGVNLHPDNIAAALALDEDTYISGHKIGIEQDPSTQMNRLVVLLEHKDREITNNELEVLVDHYRGTIIDGLRIISSEYDDLCRSMPEQSIPLVRVHRNAEGPFAEDADKLKRNYIA